MLNGMPRIVREGLWVGGGHLAIAVASLAGVRILTTYLRPEDYGEFTLILGLVTLGSGLFVLPFSLATLRFYPSAAAEGRIGAFRRLSMTLTVRGAGIAMMTIIAGGVAWKIFRSSPPGIAVFVLASLLLAADTVRSFEAGLLNAARRQADYSLRMALDAWCRPLLALGAILLLSPSVEIVIASYVVGSLAVSALLSERRVRAPETEDTLFLHAPGDSVRSRFLGYALPLVPIAILNWTMSLSDRYFLAAFGGAAQVGVYAAAYGLASQPFIAANALIHTVLRPVIYQAVAAGDRGRERRGMLALAVSVLGISAAGVLLVTLFSTVITSLLLGSRFREAAGLMPWIAGAYALQNVQQMSEMVLYAHGRTRRIVLIQTVAATVSLVLYFALIPRYGALGAALGTLGTFAVTSVVAGALAASIGRGPDVPQPEIVPPAAAAD